MTLFACALALLPVKVEPHSLLSRIQKAEHLDELEKLPAIAARTPSGHEAKADWIRAAEQRKSELLEVALNS